MEESNSKDSVISRLLLKNQQLSQEVKRLNQENAHFEKYVIDSITSLRHGDDIESKLGQIYELCYKSALSGDKLPLILQDEYHKLIERKKKIEEEITKILRLIKVKPVDMDQIQSNFQQLNLNDDHM